MAVQVEPHPSTAEGRLETEQLELQLLLEGVYRQYGFDFREYAPAAIAFSRSPFIAFAVSEMIGRSSNRGIDRIARAVS